MSTMRKANNVEADTDSKLFFEMLRFFLKLLNELSAHIIFN